MTTILTFRLIRRVVLCLRQSVWYVQDATSGQPFFWPHLQGTFENFCTAEYVSDTRADISALAHWQ